VGRRQRHQRIGAPSVEGLLGRPLLVPRRPGPGRTPAHGPRAPTSRPSRAMS
jgi:hypothetical protein